MEVKTWLASSGLNIADTVWKKPPAYPYGVYLDNTNVRGADERLCIREHDITIELYSDSEKGLGLAESKLEAFLISEAKAFEHVSRAWIESERHWQSTYTLSTMVEKF